MLQWRPYTPSDDTFFLLEAVKSKGVRGSFIELGCGTCYIIDELAKAGASLAVGCDIMPHPNGNKADAFRCDAKKAPFRDRSFDVVLFNPPYLPSEGLVDIAVDGGKEGVEVLFAFLSTALRIVKRGGRIYFVTSSLTNNEAIESLLNREGLKYFKLEKRLFFESLYVYEVLA